VKEGQIVALAILAIPIVAIIIAYLHRRLLSQERLRAIEKGASIPFEISDPRERAAKTRRWGIVLVALALGLAVMFVVIATVERERDALVGVGVAAIPLLIGLGLLYDYRLRSKELAAGPESTERTL